MTEAGGSPQDSEDRISEHTREIAALARLVTYARRAAQDLGVREPSYWLGLALGSLLEELEQARRNIPASGMRSRSPGVTSLN